MEQAAGALTDPPRAASIGIVYPLQRQTLLAHGLDDGFLSREVHGQKAFAPLRSCQRRLVVSTTLVPWANTPAGETVTAA